MADEDRIARIARALCIADDNNPDAEFTIVTNIAKENIGEGRFHQITAPVWTIYICESRQIVASTIMLRLAGTFFEKLLSTILSYWFIGIIGVSAIVLQFRSYVVNDITGDEAMSSLGTALVVLGVLVGLRPYFRVGISGLIATMLPKERARSLHDPTYEALMKMVQDETRSQGPRAVWAERVIAVVGIVLGHLLSGYGSLVVRLLHRG